MTNSKRRKQVLILLVLLHLLLASAYSIWNPLAEAPDEADHFAYVRQLAASRSLSLPSELTQGKHPPIYHILATIAASFGDPLDYQWLRANPDVSIEPVDNWSPNFFIHTTLENWPWRDGPLAFHMARFVSVLLSTLTVLALYRMVRVGFPNRPGLALATAGTLACLPEFAFIGGSVNNDNGAALMGTLTLLGALLLIRTPGDWRAVWWLPIVMGLGLLVKVSLLALWPVVLIGAVAGAARYPEREFRDTASWMRGAARNWQQALLISFTILFVAGIFASPWIIRNVRLYGDPLGYSFMQNTVDLRTGSWTAADTVWLLRGWFLSFWGKFGAVGHLSFPTWIYWMFAVISILSAVGLANHWLHATVYQRLVIGILALSIITVAAGIWRYSLVALGTDQGRLLYPAIAAVVTLFVLGLADLIPPRLQPPIGIAGMAVLAVLSVYGLVGIILPAFSAPPLLDANQTTLNRRSAVQFGELELVDWRLGPETDLLWHAPIAPSEDWRVTLRVVAEDGSLAWEWRRSPGYGRWSTDHWTAGTLLLDEYTIVWPEWAGPGRYLVEVGVQPYGGEYASPMIDGLAATENSYEFYALGWFEKP